MCTYHTPDTEEGEIHDGVELLTKSIKLGFLANTSLSTKNTGNIEGERLPYEGPDHDVVCNEDQVKPPLLVP
jgi:hypothetical protein